MGHQVPHALDGAPLDAGGGLLLESLAQARGQLPDLQDTERDGPLVVRVGGEGFEGPAVAGDGPLDGGAVVADVLYPLKAAEVGGRPFAADLLLILNSRKKGRQPPFP